MSEAPAGQGRAIERLLDFVLAPAAIALLAWEPNHAHGFINYNESGQYLSIVAELQSGRLLFRDLFAQYGPLQYYGLLWFFGLFGSTLASLRLYLMLGEVASLIAAFVLARAAIPSRAFAWIAGLVIVIEAHHPFWSTRWGGFRFAFVYFSLAALLLAGRAAARRPGAWLVASGAAAAAAFLHTYDAGLVAGLGAVVHFAHALRLRPALDAWLRSLACYVAGAALALLPLTIFLVATGTLGDYLVQLPLFNPGRAWPQPIEPGDLQPIVLAPGVIYLASALLLGARALRGSWRGGRDGALLMLTVCGVVLYAVSFRAIRGPQLETSLPLAVVTACHLLCQAVAFFQQGRKEAHTRTAAWASLALVVLALAAFLTIDIRSYSGGPFSWATHQVIKGDVVPLYVGTLPLDESFRPLDLERGGGSRIPGWQADEIEGVVRDLDERLGPDEPVFGYPDLGIFNFFLGRPHLTRFTIPVLAAADPMWEDEILASFEQARPSSVLMGSQLSTLAVATRHESEYLPEVRLAISRDYKLVARIGRVWVMARRE